KQWFISREIGIENFTDMTNIFRRTYRELFLQRTRKMLREATPDLQLYAQRIAQWLPVQFEPETEQALEQIFSQFEDNLFIPFADPIRYLTETVEQRSLLRNQRRMFLQRAESSMYALQRTIKNFSDRILLLKQQIEKVTSDAEGLKQFLLQHYKFQAEKIGRETDWLEIEEDGNEDYW
ncbi:MAG: helicase, partial [Microcystis sp.]